MTKQPRICYSQKMIQYSPSMSVLKDRSAKVAYSAAYATGRELGGCFKVLKVLVWVVIEPYLNLK